MTAPPVTEPVPLLEELFSTSEVEFGADRDGYRNHVYRVFWFARELGAQDTEAEHKLAVACYFHDLGIWADRTFDYIEPSVTRAASYLHERGLDGWTGEVSSMIREHHKITPAGPGGSLVEIFRRADWTDVSLGILPFGVSRPYLREVQRAFPDCGFHVRLVALTLARLRQHPLDPLPMFRW